jgi:hypothetical protein
MTIFKGPFSVLFTPFLKALFTHATNTVRFSSPLRFQVAFLASRQPYKTLECKIHIALLNIDKNSHCNFVALLPPAKITILKTQQNAKPDTFCRTCKLVLADIVAYVIDENHR